MPKVEQSKLEQELRVLLQCVQDLKYGSVTLIFQDGKLVRLERTDKYKLDD